ncbi:MAG: 2-oxoglutarate dehydrogenase E1 subunit family protein, partial [Actinomycetota bacterium]
MTPDNKFGGSFGSNEWLVDEMYERYLADPNSVEEKWREFFAGYKPGTPATTPGTPPVPKRQQQSAPAQTPTPAPTPTPTMPSVVQESF